MNIDNVSIDYRSLLMVTPDDYIKQIIKSGKKYLSLQDKVCLIILFRMKLYMSFRDIADQINIIQNKINHNQKRLVSEDFVWEIWCKYIYHVEPGCENKHL